MPRTRRQSRRQTDYEDAEDETAQTAAAVQTPTPTPTPGAVNVTDMAAIIASLQHTQTAAMERLLDRVLDHESRRASPSPSSGSSPVPAAVHQGNFARCTARFDGAQGENLDAFLDAVEAYKECTGISEINAVRGLSILLTGQAAVWWLGIKANIDSWSEATVALRGAFGDRRPPHRIYMELFRTRQDQGERTERFVAGARALLARLPPGDLSVKVQLDMVYGLLSHHIRERLRRDEIISFETLLQKARDIEDSVDEYHQQAPVRPRGSVTGKVPDRSPATDMLRRTNASISPREGRVPLASSASSGGGFGGSPSNSSNAARIPTVTARPPGSDGNATTRSRYCVYCKVYGHTRENCRKIPTSKSDSVNNNSQIVPSCYGCGEKGFARSQCKKCNSSTFSAVECVGAVQVPPSLHRPCSSTGKVDVDTQVSALFNSEPKCQTSPLPASLSVVSTTDYTPADFTASPPLRFFGGDDDSRSRSYPKPMSNLDRSYISETSETCYLDRVELKNSAALPIAQSRVTMGSRVSMKNKDRFRKINYGDFSGYSKEYQCELRPMLSVVILGLRGNAVVDTGAKNSVAGAKLYDLLRERNHPCEETTRRVWLADGSSRTRRVLLTSVPIKVSPGRSVNLQFTIFPEARNNSTLLGMDFLVAAGMVLDFHSSTWWFSGTSVKFPMEYEPANTSARSSKPDGCPPDEMPLGCFEIGPPGGARPPPVKTHDPNNASQGVPRKSMSRRDGPYRVQRVGPTTFFKADVSYNILEKHHFTDSTSYPSDTTVPIMPRKRRGRQRYSPKLASGRVAHLEGEDVAWRFSSSLRHSPENSNYPALSESDWHRRVSQRPTPSRAKIRDLFDPCGSNRAPPRQWRGGENMKESRFPRAP